MEHRITSHAAVRRTGLVALGLAVAMVAAGCSALSGPPDGDTPSTTAPAAGQTRDAACEIVDSEWGWAMDEWLALEPGATDRNDFAQQKVEHLEIISTLQGIADRVEAPDVRAALDATIRIHQSFADEVWDEWSEVPMGYPVDLNDPTNKLVILGKKITEYETAMTAAGLQRYDLCGPVQNGQTGAQACEIADGAWVDGAEAFDSGVKLTVKVKEDGLAALRDALTGIRTALSQVTVTEIHDQMADMYDAYEVYNGWAVENALTNDEVATLTDDELDAYLADAEASFDEYDSILTAGEQAISDYCKGLD